MMLFEPNPIVKSRIRSLYGQMPVHQQPLWDAVLRGCTYATVVQGDGAFRIPTGRPAVVVLGDDLDASRGPSAFHRRSLDRYLSRCMGVAIISCEALPEAYTSLAFQAVNNRQDVAIIETQPEHAPAWFALTLRAAPLAKILLCEPFPEGSLQ